MRRDFLDWLERSCETALRRGYVVAERVPGWKRHLAGKREARPSRKMPEDQVIWRHYHNDGLKYEEIAARLGISRSSVSIALARIRGKAWVNKPHWRPEGKKAA